MSTVLGTHTVVRRRHREVVELHEDAGRADGHDVAETISRVCLFFRSVSLVWRVVVHRERQKERRQEIMEFG